MRIRNAALKRRQRFGLLAFLALSILVSSSYVVLMVRLGCVKAAQSVYEGTLGDFSQRFDKVQVGMRKDDVIEVLGSPDEVSSEFRLGQRGGYERAYQAAAASGATEFLMWFRGIDSVYTVGFDRNGEAKVVECGGT